MLNGANAYLMTLKSLAYKKAAIYALTKTYLGRGTGVGFHDLVQGKGLGVNFLL